MRYDTIVEFNAWTQKLNIQLYLAHVARKKYKKKKLQQTKASASSIQYRLRSVKAVQAGSTDRWKVRKNVHFRYTNILNCLTEKTYIIMPIELQFPDRK